MMPIGPGQTGQPAIYVIWGRKARVEGWAGAGWLRGGGESVMGRVTAGGIATISQECIGYLLFRIIATWEEADS